ncbi:RasGEF domain containing protein [Histomonas meleagridis]|uniref:RasGEF domain containing protein n=1 Tax=Histomonas meleagridis TaxID=135588 RepID=UPI00355AA414|nr:RasGEF domain containing protein [Histomonas meleagridis]KAH0799070.1 RasGEF domain containing protein [Histomonas meleagridis]
MSLGKFEKEPLPISQEFDARHKRFSSKVDIDRSRWRQRALIDSPEYKKMRERAIPIARAVAFGKMYLPDHRYISPDILISLISQHLRTLGLLESQTSLHSEWDGKFEIPAQVSHSQLNILIQHGIYRAERFWDLTKPSQRYEEKERLSFLDEEISRTIGGLPVMTDNSKPLESEKLEDPTQILVDPTTHELQRASLNQLILLLTSKTDIKLTDVATAFCLTYKTYATSQVLFSKIRERFMMVIKNDDKYEIDKTFELFGEWLNVNGDEIEQTVIDAVKTFIDKYLRPNFQRHCLQLFDKATKSTEKKSDYSQFPPVNIGKTIQLWKGSFSVFDLPPDEFAKQLTIWSCSKFYAIQRTELLNASWENARLMHRSPNVVALNKHSNQVTNWVKSNILLGKTFEARVKLISYFTQVMRHLYKMYNFYDTSSISFALNSEQISRLKTHKDALAVSDHKFIDEMNSIFGDSSTKLIQEQHQIALKKKVPSLPHLGVLLNFLGRYDATLPNTIDGLINVVKCAKTYKLIKDIEVFKKPQYQFLPIQQIQEIIGNLQAMEEEAMTMASAEIEPDN